MVSEASLKQMAWRDKLKGERAEVEAAKRRREGTTWAFTFGADHRLTVKNEFVDEGRGIPLQRRYVLLTAGSMAIAVDTWVGAFGPGSFGEVYPWDEVTKAKLEGWGLTELGLFR